MTQTISDALHTATLLLERSSASARLDAELLLEYVTGLSRTDFRAAPERELPAAAGWSFQQLIRRRLQGEPVAYIRGHQEFWSLLLEVTPAVLIPRPETELVVERTLAQLRPDATGVADLGTGSGAIALAVADELPESRVVAADTSFDAVRVAQSNAERLGLAERVDVVLRGFDSLDGAKPEGGAFDLLLANLPYVSETEWEGLEPEIREYEPRDALVAGPTGLEVIEALLAVVGAMKVPPASIVIEIGAEQGDAATELVRQAGYGRVEVRRDLAGHDRAVIGR